LGQLWLVLFLEEHGRASLLLVVVPLILLRRPRNSLASRCCWPSSCWCTLGSGLVPVAISEIGLPRVRRRQRAL
jgi:hypothetical protein